MPQDLSTLTYNIDIYIYIYNNYRIYRMQEEKKLMILRCFGVYYLDPPNLGVDHCLCMLGSQPM